MSPEELDHALRTPLTVVLGETELVLAHDDVAPDERRRSAEAVIAAVRRIETLLGQWRAEVSS